MNESQNDPFDDDIFDGDLFADDLFADEVFTDDPFSDLGPQLSHTAVPQKRKRDNRPKSNVKTLVFVFLVSMLVTIALSLFGRDHGLPGANVYRESLPAYSFDENTVATETVKITTQYPDTAYWVRHQNLDVSLWLPPEFRALDVDMGVKNALIGLDSLGEETAYQAELLRQTQELFQLMAQSGYRSVVVARERPMIYVSYDQYMAAVEGLLPQTSTLDGYEMIELQGVSAVRYYISQSVSVADVTSVGYVVYDGDYIYVVTFSDVASDDDQKNIELYDQIMQTFRVSRTD